MNASALTWLLVAAAVGCNAGAQLLIKRAAVADAFRLQAWLSPQLMAAILLYGVSFGLTALVFARFPLSLISPLMAGAVFMLVALLSVVFLGESLGPARVAGMVCVVIGISLLARGQ